MTRLAFQLKSGAEDFRAAASRIAEVEIVEGTEEAEAVACDESDKEFGDKSVLLVGAPPEIGNNHSSRRFPAFPWRFRPDVKAIRDSLEAGNLGKPGLLRMHVWGTPSDPVDDSKKISAVDLALWLIGNPVDVVHKVEADPVEIIHLGFYQGAMAILDFTTMPSDGGSYRSLSLIGSKGAAYADDHRDRNLVFAGGAPRAYSPDFRNSYIQPMLESFITGVRELRTADRSVEAYKIAERIVREGKP